MKKSIQSIACVVALASAFTANAHADMLDQLIAKGAPIIAASLEKRVNESAGQTYQPAPGSSQIDVGFSPKRGAEELVVRAIASARQSIRVAAYSFTSEPIVRALVAAKKRGVDVALVADYRNNFVDGCGAGRPCKGKHAIAALMNAGINARVISSYKIFHHKTIVVDAKHVQTGSFNYSAAAANSNAENALVIWNNPDLAKQYLAMWDRYWSEGEQPPIAY